MRTITVQQFIRLSPEDSESFTGKVTHGMHLVEYYVNGMVHREFGPAAEYTIGGEVIGYYSLDDVNYTEKEYWHKMLDKYRGTDQESLVLVHILGE